MKWQKLKVAYTALPRVTPPHATNCLLERIGGTSLATLGPKRAADGVAGFPESSETTSPLRVTSYWGPDGSTKMVRRLEYDKDRKHTVSRDYEVMRFGSCLTYNLQHWLGLFMNTCIHVLLWVALVLSICRGTCDELVWGTLRMSIRSITTVSDPRATDLINHCTWLIATILIAAFIRFK